MIKTTLRFDPFFSHKTDCLTVFCTEGKSTSSSLKALDKALKGMIAESMKSKRFEGKTNQTLLLSAKGFLRAAFVLLIGIGKSKEVSEETIRQAAGTAAKLAEKSSFKQVSFSFMDIPLKGSKSAKKKPAYDLVLAALAEGAYLSLYHFDHYKNQDGDEAPSRINQITILAEKGSDQTKITRGIDRARKIAESVCAARDLILHPSNTATPSYLANFARKLAKKYDVSCKILGLKEMQKLGMGALLGVAKGTHEPPKFIVLDYKGSRKNSRPVAFVGKGVTFDTGGISLKPPANMDEMKMDMSGAAATLGLMQAVVSLKIPVNVMGIVPATENMPGGSAVKPGDILTSLSGKTIEVLNTDAEGRLILSDALSYAQRFKPKTVIDLATLTGAVLHALGHHFCAGIGNNDELIEQLKISGEATGERVWQLPLTAEYEKAMKSSVADLKNIAGPGVAAGTITGAAFLKTFAGEQPWVHLDIAGTAWSSEEKPYVPKGAVGFGVRLLLHYLEQNCL